MAEMLNHQFHEQIRLEEIIVGQIKEQHHLHQDYIAQVTQLKQFAVHGFAQNSERTRAGLNDLLSKMHFSESKLHSTERKVTDTSQLAEKLREVADHHQTREQLLDKRSNISSSLEVPKYEARSERDRFSFSATIVGHCQGEIEHVVARAKMDTGCEGNWISDELLDRAGLAGSTKPVESDKTYLGFGGVAFEPLGTLEITWFGVNTAKSWKNEFLVHQEGPFDMVLGSTWITEDSLLTLSQPALALRMNSFTKGRQIPPCLLCSTRHH